MMLANFYNKLIKTKFKIQSFINYYKLLINLLKAISKLKIIKKRKNL